jgi:hypothetical protein
MRVCACQEDDVYVQSDKTNTSTELVYDEFVEAVARMYHTRYAKMFPKSSIKKMLDGDDGLDLAFRFDAWLSEVFLPAAFAAIKAKKMKTPK